MDLNTLFDNPGLNLEILSEELSEAISYMAEVIKIKSKVIRFGLANTNPDTGELNKELLEKEVGHVLAMIDILVANGILDKSELKKHKLNKFAKLQKYYKL